MPRSCQKPLKLNPFITSRNPVTGRWEVVPATDHSPQTEACEEFTHSARKRE